LQLGPPSGSRLATTETEHSRLLARASRRPESPFPVLSQIRSAQFSQTRPIALASPCNTPISMLLRSAMRAAVCGASAAPARPVLALLQQQHPRHLWTCPEEAAAQPCQTPPAALQQTAQRASSLRCYSSAQASSSSGSSSPEATGPRKLKYNLRPLNKGVTAASVVLSIPCACMHADPVPLPPCCR
jgi:hypothetical protein